jgi:hypothetical protein
MLAIDMHEGAELVHLSVSLLNSIPPLPLDSRLYLRLASAIWRGPTGVTHPFKLRSSLRAVPDPTAIAGRLRITRDVGNRFLVAIEIGNMTLGAGSDEENREKCLPAKRPKLDPG